MRRARDPATKFFVMSLSEEGEPKQVEERDEETTSALHDNIDRKGKNSYYYAHSHQATGPTWDGRPEPRLLSATSSSGLSPPASSHRALLMARSNITSYAFVDEENRVKIYVNLPGVGLCPDESIAIEHSETSMCLTVKDYTPPSTKVQSNDDGVVIDTAPEDNESTSDRREAEERCLSFGKLYGTIEKAALKKKNDKVIITLTKAEAKPWKAVMG